MTRAQLLVELPDGMSLMTLREMLEMNEVTVHALRRVDAVDPPAPRKRRFLQLTPTERLVLTALGDCDTNAEIAAQLNLSPATVKSHVE
ncbi:MAG: LuxR C-terminal-related transcriptional regulator, partial [Abditibacteriales bacterium]|nr:LuxR C-terminal-related transcriptional regulator [Abditibacteriales bacterium]